MGQLVRRNGMRVGGYAHAARAAWKGGQLIGRALKRKWNSSGGSKRSRSSRGATYGNLTFQNDEAVVYRRKRAPRRVRRRHRKAFKNFMYNMDKLQSMKTCVIYNRSLFTATPTGVANGQAPMGVTMYGYNANTYASNSDLGNGDMGWIFARENGAFPTATEGSRKLRFRSCVMELTITNELAAGGTGDIYGIGIFDIYHVIARKNNGITSDPADFWTRSLNLEAAGNMPTAITTSNQLGITPFDATNFGKYWLVKKKRRVRLSPGQVYNFQMRDPGNYVLQMSELLDIKAKSNMTEGVIIVGYNSSYKFLDPDYVPGDVEYSVTYRKTYHYTEVNSSVDTVGT